MRTRGLTVPLAVGERVSRLLTWHNKALTDSANTRRNIEELAAKVATLRVSLRVSALRR